MTQPSVAYFAPDSTQGSVAKRIACFQDEGLDVTSLTFRRDRVSSFVPTWRNIDLGAVPNEQYLRRALKAPQVLASLWRARRYLRRAEIYYARMLDSALIAMAARRMFNPGARLYYEVCDIRRVMMNPGPVGRTARALERRVLATSDRIVVNSPAFVTSFLEPRQGFRGKSFLLENKVYAKDLSPYMARRSKTMAEPAADGPPLLIAWFGNLDDPLVWRAIQETARRFPHKVRFYLRGYPIIDAADFASGLAACPNIEFGGPFNNLTDLPDMYSRVNAVLGLDLLNREGNSWWLLPNSFYEAGAFCRPIITSEGTITASRISASRTGWVLKEPIEETLPDLVGRLSPDACREVELRLAATDPRAYAGQDEFRTLLNLMHADVRSQT